MHAGAPPSPCHKERGGATEFYFVVVESSRGFSLQKPGLSEVMVRHKIENANRIVARCHYHHFFWYQATRGSGCWSWAAAQQTRGLIWIISAGVPFPVPWPKPRDEQNWSGVLYSKRGVEKLSPRECIRGPWGSQGRGSRAVRHHTRK